MLRPCEDQPHCGDNLGDPDYWGPYVLTALERERLARERVETPFVGTFPTFLVGEVVVKFFGGTFDGRRAVLVEETMHRLLADHPAIPVPELIASGQLWEDEPTWPYVITRRLAGRALRELDRIEHPSARMALELGEAVARLYRLEAPVVAARREKLGRLRGGAPERLRRFGFPSVLANQVADYLKDALPADTVVHGDLTGDHVFVRDSAIEGIIDWGDAMVADPYYELVPLFLDAFGGSRDRLRSFLDAYGWRASGAEFARRALQAILSFRFDTVAGIKRVVELDRVRDLGELAERLFAGVS